MKFVLNRNYVLASLFGHSIRFEKGVATHVPPECYKEAIGIGALPEEEVELDPPVEGAVEEPTDPIARSKAVFAAFEAIVLRNDRNDFTAAGLPHAKAVTKELGWKLENKERDLLWTEFQNKDAA